MNPPIMHSGQCKHQHLVEILFYRYNKDRHTALVSPKTLSDLEFLFLLEMTSIQTNRTQNFKKKMNFSEDFRCCQYERKLNLLKEEWKALQEKKTCLVAGVCSSHGTVTLTSLYNEHVDSLLLSLKASKASLHTPSFKHHSGMKFTTRLKVKMIFFSKQNYEVNLWVLLLRLRVS